MSGRGLRRDSENGGIHDEEPKKQAGERRQSRPAPLVYYATGSGGTTLDTGEGGGNPFASVLIGASGEKTLRLRNLAARLKKRTYALSQGHQVIECRGDPLLPGWQFTENNHPAREKRAALVLVVSDYSASGEDMSLPGAARDERRIAAMLAQYGFSVDQGIGPRRLELTRALASFRHRSRGSDIAIIYSTGHGIECDGMVYLLPGDYPVHEGYKKALLRNRAVSVSRIVSAATAGAQNIVFFAGCRSQVSNIRTPGKADADGS
ncbi:MAG: hypothetical protein EHM53_07760 [Methanoregulaceae archaeon]|nr:MAG: hypothetical protein EHM53_07760 [Methanoregulaceae archaeon]